VTTSADFVRVGSEALKALVHSIQRRRSKPLGPRIQLARYAVVDFDYAHDDDGDGGADDDGGYSAPEVQYYGTDSEVTLLAFVMFRKSTARVASSDSYWAYVRRNI